MVPPQAAPKQTIAEQSKEEPFVGLYTMFFRQHTNALQTKNFRCTGDLKAARARAETHCSVIGAKLNFVQPLISDLKKEEEFTLGLNRETTSGL